MNEFFDSAEFSKAVTEAVDLASYDIHNRWCQERTVGTQRQVRNLIPSG